MRAGWAFLAVAIAGCGESFVAAESGGTTSEGGNGSGAGGTTEGAGAGGAGGGAGGAGATTAGVGAGGAGGAGGGAGGGAPTYGPTVCDVPTGIEVNVDPPACTSGTGCVVDWAGVFGEPGHVDGSAGAARFAGIYGLAVGPTDLYMTTAHAVRRVNLVTGVVDTLAGSGKPGKADGQGTQAELNCPRGIAFGDGALFVADSGNHSVRRIDLLTQAVTTLEQEFESPGHVFTRGGQLYVSVPSQVQRYDLTMGTLYAMPSDGEPSLSHPTGMVWIDMWGLFYVADSGNHIVRKLTNEGLGNAQIGSSQPGYLEGNGTAAMLDEPLGMALRPLDHTVFIADHKNHRVRKFVAGAYATSTVAGDGTASHHQGQGTAARILHPTDVAYHPVTSALFIAEGTVIRRVQLD